MAGKCKILLWDRNSRVSGVVAVRKGDAVTKLASVQGTAGTPFVSQLREVNAALKKYRTDAIVLGGFLPEYVCLEIPSPNVDRRTLQNMLRFELPGFLPVPAEGMSVFFRQIDDGNGRKKTRVFAVRSRVWRELLDQIREAGIKFDAVCHPFMAVEASCAFPEVAPGLELAAGEGGLVSLKRAEPFGGPDASADVLAAYALSREFRQDKAYLADVPEEFRIHRFKTGRRIAIVLTLIVAVAGSSLLYRHWADRDRQVEQYRRAIGRIDEQLLAQNAGIENERVLGAFAGKMLEVVNEELLLPVLGLLSGKLPGNVWMTSFRGGNNRIALTLSVTGEASGLNEVWGELGNWELENQRQQDGPDGTRILYITLKRK